jgi:hypothetical protein
MSRDLDPFANRLRHVSDAQPERHVDHHLRVV